MYYKKINIIYCSYLVNITKQKSEQILTKDINVRTVYAKLSNKYMFPFFMKDMHVFINNKIVPWDSSISDGDTVRLISPVLLNDIDFVRE